MPPEIAKWSAFVHFKAFESGRPVGLYVGIIENLFAADLAFLQEMYRRINSEGHNRAAVVCPECGHGFAVDLAGGRLGES